MKKDELRKLMKYYRDRLSDRDRYFMSIRITESVLSLKEIKKSNVFFIYNSYASEVDTHIMIRRLSENKTVYIPVVDGDTMYPVIPYGDEYRKNIFGVDEPFEYQVGIKPVDVTIIPLLACDVNGNRVGHGKGYYDKYLYKNPCLKIGICYDFQIVDNVDKEELDIPLDVIVSEKKIIRIKRPAF